MDGDGYGMFGPRTSMIHIYIPGTKNGLRKASTEGMKGLRTTFTLGLVMDVAANWRKPGMRSPPCCYGATSGPGEAGLSTAAFISMELLAKEYIVRWN